MNCRITGFWKPNDVRFLKQVITASGMGSPVSESETTPKIVCLFSGARFFSSKAPWVRWRRLVMGTLSGRTETTGELPLELEEVLGVPVGFGLRSCPVCTGSSTLGSMTRVFEVGELICHHRHKRPSKITRRPKACRLVSISTAQFRGRGAGHSRVFFPVVRLGRRKSSPSPVQSGGLAEAEDPVVGLRLLSFLGAVGLSLQQLTILVKSLSLAQFVRG